MATCVSEQRGTLGVMSDDACWLDRTCLSCGRFLETGHDRPTCLHCGAERVVAPEGSTQQDGSDQPLTS